MLDFDEIRRRRQEEAERLNRERLAKIPFDDAAGLLSTPAERRQSHINAGLIPYGDESYTEEAAIQWLKNYRRYDAAVNALHTMAEQGDARAAAWLAAHGE